MKHFSKIATLLVLTIVGSILAAPINGLLKRASTKIPILYSKMSGSQQHSDTIASFMDEHSRIINE